MDLQVHIAALLSELVCTFGMPEGERPDVWVMGDELSKQGDQKRFSAWTVESVLYALREIQLGDRCNWKVVLRCYGQAKLYNGRTGGFVSSYRVNDALSCLEDVIATRIARES